MIANTNRSTRRLKIPRRLFLLAAATVGHMALGFYVTVSPYTCGNISGGCPRIAGFEFLRLLAAFPGEIVIAIFPSLAQVDFVRSDFFWWIVAAHSFSAVYISYGVFSLLVYLAKTNSRLRR